MDLSIPLAEDEPVANMIELPSLTNPMLMSAGVVSSALVTKLTAWTLKIPAMIKGAMISKEIAMK